MYHRGDRPAHLPAKGAHPRRDRDRVRRHRERPEGRSPVPRRTSAPVQSPPGPNAHPDPATAGRARMPARQVEQEMVNSGPSTPAKAPLSRGRTARATGPTHSAGVRSWPTAGSGAGLAFSVTPPVGGRPGVPHPPPYSDRLLGSRTPAPCPAQLLQFDDGRDGAQPGGHGVVGGDPAHEFGTGPQPLPYEGGRLPAGQDLGQFRGAGESASPPARTRSAGRDASTPDADRSLSRMA
jgi:hypothetical protein